MSRREADTLIDAGRVKVDGARATLGTRVQAGQSVTIDNHAVALPTDYRYFMLHKPTGYVCSRKKQGDTPTIFELVPPELQRLKPVGRLDKDSSGLLILTDDGDLAHQMTHPRFHKTKTYEVKLDHELAPLHRQMISDHGISLDDGVSKLQLERLTDGDETQWIVRMHEGRNRQIRRTFDALGYTVVGLHRTQFGPYILNDLRPGELLKIEMI